jgi:hypothetical protein
LRLSPYPFGGGYEERIKLLDCLDKGYRVHYFLRRSIATVLEFRGALEKLSRTDEYKKAKKSTFDQNAPDSKNRQRDLYAQVSKSLTFFNANHDLLKNLRNAVGGYFSYEAATAATENPHDGSNISI